MFYVPSDERPLRQGEVIENLFEVVPPEIVLKDIRARMAAGSAISGDFEKVDHKYSIIVSQDCDLDLDYKARQGQVPEDKLLWHVLFCDLYPVNEIKARNRLDKQLYRRAQQNQDERYHFLGEAPVAGTEVTIPELLADFKAVFAIPVEIVYTLISSGEVFRMGILGEPYLRDFIHRMYSFLARVPIVP